MCNVLDRLKFNDNIILQFQNVTLQTTWLIFFVQVFPNSILTFRFDRIMLLDDRLFIFLVKLLNKTNIYFDPFVISVLKC